MASKGLGDDIAKLTQFTRLNILAKKVAEAFGTDCGCDKRRETLNRMFPHKAKNSDMIKRSK